MTVLFKPYRQRKPLTKAQVRQRAAKLRRELVNVLCDEFPDQGRLYSAVRDAWLLLGYVAGPGPDPKKQARGWTDSQLIAAAHKAAARVHDVPPAYGMTLDVLQEMYSDKTLLSDSALRKRLVRLGCFVTAD